MNIKDAVDLFELLAELDKIKRATKLPGGQNESDASHSLSLTLIAYQFCTQHCPELNSQKLILFGLCHDLLEIVTGDEDTLLATPEQLTAKHEKERAALTEFNGLFERFPDLRQAVHDYEALDTPEAAAIFVLDKACTTWTHHHDGARHAKDNRNIHSKADVAAWAQRQRDKFEARLAASPPQPVLDLYEASFVELQNLYED